MTKKKQTVYIDCTATYYLGINTGIQRVVRNIIKRAPSLSAKLGIECIPIVANLGRYWRSKDFANMKQADRGNTTLIHTGAGITAKLDTHEKEVIAKSKRIPLLIFYAYAVSAVRRIIRYLGYAYLQAPFLRNLLTGRIQTVRPDVGDILLMPDSFWAYDIVSSAAKMKREGVSVIPVVHDLIPLTHPQYCDKNFIKKYSSLLPHLLHIASAVICISQSTKDALVRYMQAHEIDKYDEHWCTVSYSGADLSNEPDAAIDAMPIRAEVRRTCENLYVYLMVGTIEPRKGHEVVFGAMTRLWDKGCTDHLVIVGRIGWLCDDLVTRMKSSAYFSQYLHILNDVNDNELDYLYQHVSALIFASNIEGFGLPLVEAMGKGLPVIASDIPVFQEIGKDQLIYFEPGNTRSLTTALSTYKDKYRGHEKVNYHVTWPSWDESTEQLLRKVLELAGHHR